MPEQETTISHGGAKVQVNYTSKNVKFFPVSKTEIDSLMNTSFEFQIFLALASLCLGAFISSLFSDRNNTLEITIFFVSIITSIIFSIFCFYFYRKMKEEKAKILVENETLQDIVA